MGPTATEDLVESIDQRVYVRMSWSDFEAFLKIKGDASMPRIAYLDGVLELMTTSRGHEYTKKNVARLVEAYAEELEIELWGYGQWTLKKARKKAVCTLST